MTLARRPPVRISGKGGCDCNEQCMGDLLADLMQLADGHGFAFDCMVADAAEPYGTEVTEEGGHLTKQTSPEIASAEVGERERECECGPPVTLCMTFLGEDGHGNNSAAADPHGGRFPLFRFDYPLCR